MDFEQLYNAYFMKVYSFLLTLSRNRDLAEELAQKTFFKAMTGKGQFRGECSEYTWLCAIGKNLYTEELRRQRRSGELGIEAADPADMDSAMEDEEALFRIHQILHRLEEPYKEVFQLRVFGELSFYKIGAIFGKTENWARVTYHRARLKIQERMGNT